MKNNLNLKSALVFTFCLALLACNKDNNILNNKEDTIDANDSIGNNNEGNINTEEFNNTAPNGKKYIKLINGTFSENNEPLKVPSDPDKRLPYYYATINLELYDENIKDSLVVIGRQIADKYDEFAMFTLASWLGMMMPLDPTHPMVPKPLRVREQHFEFNGAENHNLNESYDAIGVFLQVPRAIKYKLEFYIVQMEKGKIIRRSNTVTYDINTVESSNSISNKGMCPGLGGWACQMTGYTFKKITVH